MTQKKPRASIWKKAAVGLGAAAAFVVLAARIRKSERQKKTGASAPDKS